MTNPAAALGKLSWEKRPKKQKTKKYMRELALRKHALDKAAASTPNA